MIDSEIEIVEITTEDLMIEAEVEMAIEREPIEIEMVVAKDMEEDLL